jgi:hypothetical protein
MLVAPAAAGGAASSVTTTAAVTALTLNPATLAVIGVSILAVSVAYKVATQSGSIRRIRVSSLFDVEFDP